ncbi:MAG: hypothetical protein AAB350_01405 [Patescibacteria group bacterium]
MELVLYAFGVKSQLYEVIDKNKYKPILIGVDKKGKWLLADNSKFLLNNNPELIK